MRSRGPGSSDGRPNIALIPAGDRFEDFYDKIGVSLEDFRLRQSGGWLFNYVEGLKHQGVSTVLMFGSARVAATARFVHKPSGTQVCVIPVSRLHRRLRNFAMRRDSSAQAWTSISSYSALPMVRLIRELRRHGCAAILCQEFESPRFDVCLLVGKLLRLPVFATFQGAFENHAGPERIIRPITVRSCSGLVIGASVEIAKVKARYRLPDRKIAHIPNSVDVDVWAPGDPVPPPRLQIDRRATVVAWHGRVQVERKGLDVLLESWRRLRATRPERDLRLLIIGWERDGDLLRRLIGELPAPEEVVWVDRYVHDSVEVAGYLRAATIYCLPSRHEGFAVAALEAMACGLPVVVADVPGGSDVFRTGRSFAGIVVKPEDPEELAGALGELVDSAERARALGTAGRRRVEEEFSVPFVGRQLWDYTCSRGMRDGCDS